MSSGHGIRGTATMQTCGADEYAQAYIPGLVDEDLPIVPGDRYTVEIPPGAPAIVLTPGELEFRVSSISLEPLGDGGGGGDHGD